MEKPKKVHYLQDFEVTVQHENGNQNHQYIAKNVTLFKISSNLQLLIFNQNIFYQEIARSVVTEEKVNILLII